MLLAEVGWEERDMGRKRRRKKELRGKREREARAAPEERAALALDALGRETRAQEALMREAGKAAARARDQLEREARARELEDEYRQKMERLRRKRSHGQERAAPARQRPAQRPSVSSRTRVRAEVRIRKTPAEPDGRQAEKHPAEDLPVVEVRDGVGWEVLLDGQARVVMCGEGTPFGSARNFQMSVGPAASGSSRGPLASLFNMLASGQTKAMADPFLLNPEGTRPTDAQAHADPIAPRFDTDFSAWLAPFMMGPINTRVVRRSAALLGYAQGYAYQEYLRLGRGPVAAMAAASLSAGSFTSQAALRLAPVRNLAQKLAPPPGAGPSEASMDGGSFRCQWVGHSASGKTVRGMIADQGDPGNRATTKMLCESALALALQLDELPGGRQYGGLLTPASALGDVLVERLRVAGMTLQLEPAQH